MDVKEAVHVAKQYLTEILEGERVQNLGLEEVEFDDREGVWSITLGFSRPWDKYMKSAYEMALGVNKNQEQPRREYKVVNVRALDKKVVSVKIHETVN